jgi:aryl-alcohol dehydrogenase-like predicted oxidoreductase
MADQEPATAAAAGTIRLGDFTVQRLGFGAMRVTGEGVWGPPSDPDQARAVLRRAVDLGVNFIDTADSYGPHVSETLIAEALFPYPDGLVVATKGGLERPGPGRWVPNGAPDHLVRACDGSLARLRLEQIPLYQFHRPDPRVPLEESVGALVELQQQGKIRHIGLSNVDADQLRRAQRLTPVVSVQNRYNLTDRSSESMVDLCEQQGVAFLPWAPIQEADAPVVSEIAARHHASERQVTLAWLLARSSVMLPIPGTGSPAHLEDNVAAAGLRLADDEIAELDAAGNNDSRLRRTLRSARSSVRSRTSRGGGSSAR